MTIPTTTPAATVAPVITPTAGPGGLAGLRGALFGNVGGADVGKFDESKKLCVGMFKNGLFERRASDIGAFIYKMQDLNIPYLSNLPEGLAAFKLTLPKPGYGILLSIRDFFFDIMKRLNDAEVMVQLYWDKEEEKYFLYVPEQRVQKATIHFDHSQDLQGNPGRYVWMLDIHSHNTMGAFFSGTDSADEISTRVFGVMGTIAANHTTTGWNDKINFTTKFRAGVNGKFIELAVPDIFNMEDLTPMPVPEEDYEKVKKGSFTAVGSVYPAGGATYPAAGANRPLYGGGEGFPYDDESAWDYGGYGNGGRRGGYQRSTYKAARAIIDVTDGEDVRKAFAEMFRDVHFRDLARNVYNMEVRMDGKTLESPFVYTICDDFSKVMAGLVKTTDLTDDEIAQAMIASLSEQLGFEVIRKNVDRFQEHKLAGSAE